MYMIRFKYLVNFTREPPSKLTSMPFWFILNFPERTVTMELPCPFNDFLLRVQVGSKMVPLWRVSRFFSRDRKKCSKTAPGVDLGYGPRNGSKGGAILGPPFLSDSHYHDKIHY